MGEIYLVAFLAFLGGVCLGINRTLLGRLGVGIGAARASFVNHVGGALFIFVILLLKGSQVELKLLAEAPLYAYVGGVVGALFVTITSWVIPRAGVMKTTILLISGQMIFGTILDFGLGTLKSIPVALVGLALILGGVLIGEYQKLKKASLTST